MKHLKTFEGLFDFLKPKRKEEPQIEPNSKIKVEKDQGLNYDETYNVYIVKDDKDCFKIGELRKRGNYWNNYLFIGRTTQRNRNMKGFSSPTPEQLEVIKDELSSSYNNTMTFEDYLKFKFKIVLQ